IGAEKYLSQLPKVHYVPDMVQYQIEDHDAVQRTPRGFFQFGYHPRKQKLIASQIEQAHAIVDYTLIDDDGLLGPHISEWILKLVGESPLPVLVFANHATVADAAARTLMSTFSPPVVGLVTGK